MTTCRLPPRRPGDHGKLDLLSAGSSMGSAASVQGSQRGFAEETAVGEQPEPRKIPQQAHAADLHPLCRADQGQRPGADGRHRLQPAPLGGHHALTPPACRPSHRNPTTNRTQTHKGLSHHRPMPRQHHVPNPRDFVQQAPRGRGREPTRSVGRVRGLTKTTCCNTGDGQWMKTFST